MAVLLGGRPRISHFMEKYFLVYSKLQSRKNHNTAILYLQTLHPRTRHRRRAESPTICPAPVRRLWDCFYVLSGLMGSRTSSRRRAFPLKGISG